MKDGTTLLAYKPEHAVDLDTGAVVAAVTPEGPSAAIVAPGQKDERGYETNTPLAANTLHRPVSLSG